MNHCAVLKRQTDKDFLYLSKALTAILHGTLNRRNRIDSEAKLHSIMAGNGTNAFLIINHSLESVNEPNGFWVSAVARIFLLSFQLLRFFLSFVLRNLSEKKVWPKSRKNKGSRITCERKEPSPVHIEMVVSSTSRPAVLDRSITRCKDNCERNRKGNCVVGDFLFLLFT